MDAYDAFVREALARYLDVAADSIGPTDRLREDLGLDALDLSIIGLRLERSVRREFPLAVLELIQSVDDLVRLVGAWASRKRP